MDNESDSILCTICGGIAHEVHDEKTQWLECGNNENHFATFWTHEWIDANMGEKTESGSLSPFLQKELEAHYSGEENFRKMYMCTFPAEDDLKKEWIAKFARYLGWQPDELPQDVLALGIRQYDAKNGLSHAIEVVKRQLRMPPYHDA